MITNIFRYGNKKLPESTATFSLPRMLTCPGATELCKVLCYAQKAERIYPAVKRRCEDLHTLAKSDLFPWVLKTAVSRLPERVSVIRVHVSGDFFDQKYLDTWIKVAKEFPEKTLYAYTKSHELDFSDRPSNFSIRLSLDPTSPKEIFEKRNLFDGITWLHLREENSLPDFIDSDRVICPADCKICEVCHTSKVDVILPQH